MRTKLYALIALLLLVAGSSAAARAQTTVNLADYGAVGDNVADDGPALQQALDALAAAGGGTLIVPQGRYAIVTPVSKDFTGLASSVSILGVPSSTVVDHSGPGHIKSAPLDLVSEFFPKTGADYEALVITGLDTLLIKDLAFVGTKDVLNDAKSTLFMNRIGEATVRHCEFYALSSRARNGSIITARESKLKLDQSKILGSTGSSGAGVPVLNNLSWKGVEVTDTVFGDYGQRPGLYGKMTISPLAWISIGSAAPLSSDSPRREVILRNVFMDEGGWLGVLSQPLASDKDRAKPDLMYISGMIENVGHFGQFGLKLTEIKGLLVEKSRYKWSRNSSAAIYTQRVETAIIDRSEFVDDANRIWATSETGSLYVIDSTYVTLDSEAQLTRVITTANVSDDPVQYVRQQYESVLGRAPDAAGHFYWSNLLLLCDADAQCLQDGQAKLAAYLASAPAPNFSIDGRITDENGQALAGIAVQLGGAQPVSALTDADGRYKFSGLPTSGAYTVTPVSPLYNFGPLTITTPAGDQTAQDFAATRKTFTVAGKVTFGAVGFGGQQVWVTSENPAFAARFVTTLEDGTYALDGLPAGYSYTVFPSSRIFAYMPASRPVVTLLANQSGLNFTASRKTYEVRGRVLFNNNGLNGIVIRLKNSSGVVIKSATTATNVDGVDGYYNITGVPAGMSYTVEPAPSNMYAYTPAALTIASLESNANRQSFGARRKLFAISGRVTNPLGTAGLGGVTMSLFDGSGALVKAVNTDSGGAYSLTGIPGGSNYRLIPTKAGLVFTAPSKAYNSLPADMTAQNFTGK
jgi:hypothetical protein